MGALVLAGCDDDDCCKVDPDAGAPGDGAGDGRVEVARVPAVANSDVDLLFVIDDSTSTLDKQTNLKNNFPNFINVLNDVPGGLPNVHIGVVTPDLGTKAVNDATPAPTIGTPGTGGCSGNGKGGNLQSSSVVQGTFIANTKNSDGTRTVNYTGTLADAFSSIASVGSAGCGFEQPIEAAKRALDNNPANAGFLRPNAKLAIIVMTDEDDCSVSHATLLTQDTSTLGPLQSFRCTRFGVTCDVNGATPDDMNQANVKGQCHSNESSTYLMPMGPYATFFKGLKQRDDDVLFAALIGDPTPVEVEMRTPPASSTPIPALAHSCEYASANGLDVADPGVRIAELANKFPRHSIGTVCMQDLSSPLTNIAVQVRSLTGNPCLTQDIALPADCIARDVVGSTSTTLPACNNGASSTNKPCFELITDAASCSSDSHLKLQVQRSTTPSPDTVTVLSCKL
ncbi:MAG: hypothetical protein HOV81_01950 [Kofleriaceae bacterium]|nr:hypothetical protein [Kofleriaceae bacterium]